MGQDYAQDSTHETKIRNNIILLLPENIFIVVVVL